MDRDSSVLFLLGGYDLEMQAVRQLLEKIGFVDITHSKDLSVAKCFADQGLTWRSADISQYAPFLHFPGIIYGIELRNETNLTLPAGYRLIDHHNEWQHKPASLAQILDVLKYQPDSAEERRLFELVIANDIGHVRQMKEINATEEEISATRKLDRYAQGATDEDERLAEESLAGQEYHKDVLVVKSLTERFSCVTDRRAGEPKLIVWNDHELNYYGPGAREIKEQDWFRGYDGSYFYSGGTGDGYFGIGTMKLLPDKLEEAVHRIVEFVGKPHSCHVFILPFRWDLYAAKKDKQEFDDLLFDERTDLKEMAAQIEQEQGNNWKRAMYSTKPFLQSGIANGYSYKLYNEYIYFFDYIRDVLYDTEKEPDDSRKVNVHFEFDLETAGIAYYLITTGQQEQYYLQVTDIDLHLYNIGVGALIFSLENDDYRSKEDILKINEFGRRFYPAFLGAELTAQTKKACLADSIAFCDAKKVVIPAYADNFITNYTLSSISLGSPVKLPAYIQKILGPGFVFDEPPKPGQAKLSLVMDDRMFYMCWYGNDSLSGEVKQYKDQTGSYSYLSNDFWHCFVFGDGRTPSIANASMKRQLLEKHTYARWVDRGTLFGLNCDSFVILSDGNGAFPIIDHFKTMYYQLVLLCFLQRAGILRFTYEVSKVVHKTDDPGKIKAITDLYKNYIEFSNRIYFRQITSQAQGVELYEKLQEIMFIHDEVGNLKADMEALHAYGNMLEQAKLSNEQAKLSNEQAKLSRVATWFLPGSVVFGILGANFFQPGMKFFGSADQNAFWWIGFGIVISVAASLALFYFLKRQK